MYPTPMALSRIPFARAMFSCGTSLVIITRQVVLMNADAHPQSRRETVHTAAVTKTRASSHEGKDASVSRSRDASLSYISASHRVYGPAKGITASMQSASAASARVRIGLAPTRHRIRGTYGDTSRTPSGIAANTQPIWYGPVPDLSSSCGRNG